jgi:hypothetical protein
MRTCITELVIQTSRYRSAMFISSLDEYHKNLSGYITLHYQHQYYVCAFRKQTPTVRSS